jgi:hypothetical protein
MGIELTDRRDSGDEDAIWRVPDPIQHFSTGYFAILLELVYFREPGVLTWVASLLG